MERNWKREKTAHMKTLIGYSLDSDIRYKATSGGVGSALLKYLFEHGIIQTSISFDYDHIALKYIPKFIYSYDEYKPIGSIYHEINLVSFIKKNILDVKGGFACFCLPCQASAIRRLVESANHTCFLLGLTCSSQQHIDATYYLLKRLNINKEDVRHIQYRGNGWPSGVQIEMLTGEKISVPNNNSLWSRIFHSRLFILSRCFKCNNTLNSESDISLADPWLTSLQKDIQDGKTLIMLNTELGNKLWEDAGDYCCFSTILTCREAELSQDATIKRKEFYKQHPKKTYLLMKLNRSLWYKNLVFRYKILFKAHVVIKTLLER